MLGNDNKKIILNHRQKQGVLSEGQRSLFLQPHCCEFTTRHCFMYRGSHSELAWTGQHQKARWVLHENHQVTLQKTNFLFHQLFTPCTLASSCALRPSGFPFLFYWIDWFCVAMIKYARLCLKTEPKSEKTINSMRTMVIDCNCH